MNKKHKCPEGCTKNEFLATAHVTQEWLVDDVGNFIKAIDNCMEVTHRPSDEDIWSCSECGAVAILAE